MAESQNKLKKNCKCVRQQINFCSTDYVLNPECGGRYVRDCCSCVNRQTDRQTDSTR